MQDVVTNESAEQVYGQTITVNVPDKGYTKVSYVNTRGASLNYVRTDSINKESGHCSDRDD